MTTREAGRLLGLCSERIRQMLASGELAGVLEGRDWRVSAAGVRRELADRRESRRRSGVCRGRPRKSPPAKP